ncbi:hypothetical protein GCM10011297_26660 [Bacterioplanes sanyensis]|uniref:hypothetical protein n=1 Tax=Bacterioplanes sanyensis TaxID=1249553 RepID=UPI00167AAE22|nr:hypothetical protein [Bacterioplanes sanyensis]GGY52422.1 hypothetical protein GCM10011297_26660 [Bacterioplanes sanyensis]
MDTVKDDYQKPVQEVYESLPTETKEWVDKQVVKVWVYFGVWCIFLLTASVVLGCFILSEIVDDPIEKRIQRSGSIIPFVVVLGEALFIGKINKLASVIHPAQLTCEIYMQRRFKILVNGSLILTFIIMAVGSILSGYGDLLFRL